MTRPGDVADDVVTDPGLGLVVVQLVSGEDQLDVVVEALHRG